MNLPKDPVMLLSYVNTKLRDEFSNLESFCEAYDIKSDEIIEKLKTINYFYNREQNQFK